MMLKISCRRSAGARALTARRACRPTRERLRAPHATADEDHWPRHESQIYLYWPRLVRPRSRRGCPPSPGPIVGPSSGGRGARTHAAA
eukprot:5847612-Pyramimonas_sp.AAC.1